MRLLTIIRTLLLVVALSQPSFAGWNYFKLGNFFERYVSKYLQHIRNSHALPRTRQTPITNVRPTTADPVERPMVRSQGLSNEPSLQLKTGISLSPYRINVCRPRDTISTHVLSAFEAGNWQEPVGQGITRNSNLRTNIERFVTTSSVRGTSEVDRENAEINTHGTSNRGEPENYFRSVFPDLEVDPMHEQVDQTNPRRSNSGLNSENFAATNSDSQSDVEGLLRTRTAENESRTPALKTTQTDESESFEVASRDEENSSVTVPKEVFLNAAESNAHGDRGEHENISILSFSDLVSSTRSDPVGQTNSRDSNLELHIEMSEATGSESETAVKIPVSVESYRNESSTDERKGDDDVRQDAEYSSVTVPKVAHGNVAENYLYRDAFDRGEPDGQSSDDTSAPAAAVQTRPASTADHRQRYTAESMEALYNSSVNLQCVDSESVSETSFQDQTRHGMDANGNDNQTMQQDSFDSDELFGSGRG